MSRVAIASKDKKSVNEHFGRAPFFHIYDLTDEGYYFVESRDVVAACQHQRTHSTTDFDRVIELISDCDALLVSKIGEGAAEYLISKGVRVFETQADIDAVLKNFIAKKVLEN